MALDCSVSCVELVLLLLHQAANPETSFFIALACKKCNGNHHDVNQVCSQLMCVILLHHHWHRLGLARISDTQWSLMIDEFLLFESGHNNLYQ